MGVWRSEESETRDWGVCGDGKDKKWRRRSYTLNISGISYDTKEEYFTE